MIEAALLISPPRLEINLTPQQEARFWAKVDRRGPDECWEWKACRNSAGYGQFWVINGMVYAHRIAWTLAHGPIPDGMCVCHRCDHPECVNAASHLFLGTHLDNMRDKESKGRSCRPSGDKHGARTHPESRPRGEGHGRAKLTEGQVREMRDRHASGGVSYSSLARELGVSPAVSRSVIHRKTWSHVA